MCRLERNQDTESRLSLNWRFLVSFETFFSIIYAALCVLGSYMASKNDLIVAGVQNLDDACLEFAFSWWYFCRD